jgi:hypothetical protein
MAQLSVEYHAQDDDDASDNVVSKGKGKGKGKAASSKVGKKGGKVGKTSKKGTSKKGTTGAPEKQAIADGSSLRRSRRHEKDDRDDDLPALPSSRRIATRVYDDEIDGYGEISNIVNVPTMRLDQRVSAYMSKVGYR